MALDCTFELNNKSSSTLLCGEFKYPAFSGLGKYVNDATNVCLPDQGPIPKGTYYIVDRESGGLLGPVVDYFKGRNEWFALYADDGTVNDETFCDKVKRGNFRLHPKGSLGISKGCITLENIDEFRHLRALLKKTSTIDVPGTKLKAYGKVVVK